MQTQTIFAKAQILFNSHKLKRYPEVHKKKKHPNNLSESWQKNETKDITLLGFKIHRANENVWFRYKSSNMDQQNETKSPETSPGDSGPTLVKVNKDSNETPCIKNK